MGVKGDIPGTEAQNEEYPFCDCWRPKPYTEYCFLAAYDTEEPLHDPRLGPRARRFHTDYIITEGIAEASSYLSMLFEQDIDDPIEFISGMNQKQIRRVLSANYVNGQLNGDITFYLCDTGPGGGIWNIHSRSMTLEL